MSQDPNGGHQEQAKDEQGNQVNSLLNSHPIAETHSGTFTFEAGDFDDEVGDKKADDKANLLMSKPYPASLMAPAIIIAISSVLSGAYWWTDWGKHLVNRKGDIFSDFMHHGWTMVTAIFVHSGMPHLVANTGLMLVFGWLLRAYIGSLAFPWLALAAGVVTQLLSLLTYRDEVLLLGASGMIYAMAGMWLAFYILLDRGQTWKGRIFRAVGFALVVLMPTQLQANVSYRAHGIGFAVGFIFALLSLNIVTRHLQAKKNFNVAVEP